MRTAAKILLRRNPDIGWRGQILEERHVLNSAASNLFQGGVPPRIRRNCERLRLAGRPLRG